MTNPSPRPLTVALAGIGGYGNTYAQALLAVGEQHGLHLVAGIDPFAQRAPAWEQFRQAGIPIYTTLQEFYPRKVDLLMTAAPIHLHVEHTCLGLANGSAVLCEKPLAATVADGLRMRTAERETGLPVGIGYQWSFAQATQALKQDILAGVLGRPLRLKALVLWPRRRSYYQRSAWAGRVRMPDGAWVWDSPINNAVAHYLHHMLYLLGGSRETSARVQTVQAELYRANPIENFDSGALRAHLENGAEVLFYTAHCIPEEVGPLMRFEFERAVVTYDRFDQPEFVAQFADGSLKRYGSPDEGRDDKLWQMADALRGGLPPACGIEASFSHAAVVHAIHQSVPQVCSAPQDVVRLSDAETDSLTWVEGMAEAWQAAYASNCLPVELGTLSWAQVGRAVSLDSLFAQWNAA